MHDRVPRWLARTLLAFALVAMLLGWVMRDVLLLGAFFLLGGAYVAIHAGYLLLTKR